jgi:hypothetical protein
MAIINPIGLTNDHGHIIFWAKEKDDGVFPTDRGDEAMKKTAIAAGALAIALGVATSAGAETLAAYRGQPIDLGGINGTAYYTVEKGGYRVIVTLAEPGSKAIRIETVLARGQSVVVSSPAAIGEAPARIEISRRGSGVEVQKATVVN